MCVSRPLIAREQILRAASRQFTAGDVQHWWLPTSGLGVKTRISDDRVWLPFVVAHYLEVTEDFGVLDEPLAFSRAIRSTPEQQRARFRSCSHGGEPRRCTSTARARSNRVWPSARTDCRCSAAGDWNDGMNRVGAAGRGESVWLGWFLYATLMRFAPLAERRGDADKAALWRKHAFTRTAGDRARSVGRGLVPARLFRRRHSVGIGIER